MLNKKEPKIRTVEDYKALLKFNSSIFGHVDHGKTTCTTAITQWAHLKYGQILGSGARTYEQIDNTPEEKARGITINPTCVLIPLADRVMTLADLPGHQDYMKNMIVGNLNVRNAFLVVSLFDGVMEQTREHVTVSRQLGTEKLIVILTKKDMLDPDDAEMIIELAKQDIETLLVKHGFKDSIYVPVSAKRALETRDFSDFDILEEAIYSHFQIIEAPCSEEDFLMHVSGTNDIKGRGIVAVGCVTRGLVSTNMKVDLVGITLAESIKGVVVEVQAFKKSLNTAGKDENIGLLLRFPGVTNPSICRGQSLLWGGRNNKIKASTKFRAEMYVCEAEMGGRSKPFSKSFEPQAFINAADTTMKILRILDENNNDKEILAPGEHAVVEIELLKPVYLEPLMKITVRESKKTIAGMKVIEVLN